MESDILFDQILTVFGEVIAQRHFRVIRKEKAREFDYRMMVLESSSLKIRFTLERGLVNLAVSTLDAPNDWSRDQWFELDVLLDYLAEQKVSPLLNIAYQAISHFIKHRNHGPKGLSIVHDTDDHITSVLRQLNELKQKFVSSYDEIEMLFDAMSLTRELNPLNRFRARRDDNILSELTRKR